MKFLSGNLLIIFILVIYSSLSFAKTQSAKIYMCVEKGEIDCQNVLTSFQEIIKENKKLKLKEPICTGINLNKIIKEMVVFSKFPEYPSSCNEVLEGTLEGEYTIFPTMKVSIPSIKIDQILPGTKKQKFIEMIQKMDGVRVAVDNEKKRRFAFPLNL